MKGVKDYLRHEQAFVLMECMYKRAQIFSIPLCTKSSGTERNILGSIIA